MAPKIEFFDFTIDSDKQKFLVGRNKENQNLWAGIRLRNGHQWLEITPEDGQYSGVDHVVTWQPEVLCKIHPTSLQIRRHDIKRLWNLLFDIKDQVNGAKKPSKGLQKINELIVHKSEFQAASEHLKWFAAEV